MHELWKKARGSVRLRITVAATLVFALAFGIAAWAVVRAVHDRLEDQVRQDAQAGLERIALSLQQGTAGAPSFAGGGLVTYRVTDMYGNVVAGAPAGPNGATTGFATPVDPLTGEPIPGDYVIVRQAALVDGKPVTITGASPLAEVQRSVDALGQVLVWITPALVAGVGILVWLLVGRALRPVALITREVEEITHTTMHRRVPEPSSNDEVHELARTMNDMLERLEAASERQRAFVSDASHELRTPVATVQALLEVGLRSGDVESAAQRALEANSRLGTVVEDLLDLARLDGVGLAVDDLPLIDLEEVVFAALGPEPDALVDTRMVLAGRMRGDRALLARVVRNLVENARRHTRTRVAVSVVTVGHDVVLTVDDDGPGVSPADRERIFERFVRLDDGRRRRDGGTGLGLSIVKRVVEQHGGVVRVADAPLGGARFTVILPAADRSGSQLWGSGPTTASQNDEEAVSVRGGPSS
jgi:signal transduction histidine kinase